MLLSELYEKLGELREAASTLTGIPIESGQRQYSDEMKITIYLRIAWLYLEEDDPVQAEAYVNRASVLHLNPSNEELSIRYKVSG